MQKAETLMICPEGAYGEKNMITIQSERLTAEEYIDIQIESEKTEKKPGYKDRIKSLESIKQNNKLIESN